MGLGRIKAGFTDTVNGYADMTEKPRKPTGPKPERLKLKGDWRGLVGKALARKRPAKGWPKRKGGKR